MEQRKDRAYVFGDFFFEGGCLGNCTVIYLLQCVWSANNKCL